MTAPLGYRVAYRVGIAPWEQAGRHAAAQLARLLDREEAEREQGLGKALDVGCGRGAHSLDLAVRGWDVTGVDVVPHAIEQARRAPGSGAVRFLVGDVTDLADTAVGGGYDFFLDIGCLHGLTDEQRHAAGAGITAAATPTATMLMMAFAPGHRGPLPHGVSRPGLEGAFPAWQVVDVEPAQFPVPAVLRGAAPAFYRLRRR